MPAAFVGAPLRRFEDPRLLRGQGTFVEDVALARALHVAFVRSPYPHARLASVDLEPACATPGVVAAFDAHDLGPRRIQASISHPALRPCAQPILALERVRYVGEPVAVVVADSPAAAGDGQAAADVTYEPLEPVPSAEVAVSAGAPLLHAELGDNLAGAFEVVVGDPDAQFARADHVVSGRFYVQRYAGMPLETRGVAAVWDVGRERLTVWSSTQWPHTVRDSLAGLLGLPEHAIRVVAPDVGGGFGIKQDVYPEEVVLPLVAMRLGRPVTWVETRREHQSTAVHAREQWHDMQLAVTRDGTILAMQADVLCDQGAYTRSLGILCPSLTAAGLPGPYRFHHYRCRVRVALTNKAPAAAYRGAGQPEAVFATERIIDRIAETLGLDPADVRRQNFIRPDEFPWDVGTESAQVPVVYDSGEYAAGLDRALELARYTERRQEQAAERARSAEGRLLGLGLAAYVMLTGLGPYESAELRVDPTGKVRLVTGASPHGQGTATALAQIVADELGVAPHDVRVVHGDTDAIPYGIGTYASRNAVVAGSAALEAARKVREKALRLAAQLLEAAPEDLQLVPEGAAPGGRVPAGSEPPSSVASTGGQAPPGSEPPSSVASTGASDLGPGDPGSTRGGGAAVEVRGAPGRRLTLARLAAAAAPGQPLPDGLEPDLAATAYFPAPRATFASGVHVAWVEVDRDTLEVRILDYAVLSDAGPLINPLIAEGQIAGGVAQGIGGALYEELAYDAQAQLVSQSLLDYCMPTAYMLPPVRIAHLHTRSPLNPLGVKGLGEGGAMAPPAAIANAVEDALAPLGVRITATPLTPSRLAALLNEV